MHSDSEQLQVSQEQGEDERLDRLCPPVKTLLCRRSRPPEFRPRGKGRPAAVMTASLPNVARRPSLAGIPWPLIISLATSGNPDVLTCRTKGLGRGLEAKLFPAVHFLTDRRIFTAGM